MCIRLKQKQNRKLLIGLKNGKAMEVEGAAKPSSPQGIEELEQSCDGLSFLLPCFSDSSEPKAQSESLRDWFSIYFKGRVPVVHIFKNLFFNLG